uniref:F-box domain-containing protein n=1 Tax=Panagrolaimus sp. JU765 TaxID=591449 RepID=A0AC34RBY9_9BILA
MGRIDYFPYMNLPLLVQEMIADEIVENLCFTEQKQFILTSKFCKSLIQQSKLKKRIRIKSFHYDDDEMYCKTYDSNVLSFKTADDLVKFLKIVNIVELDLSGDFYQNNEVGLLSPLKNSWFDALEYLETLTITVNVFLVKLIMKILPEFKNL